MPITNRSRAIGAMRAHHSLHPHAPSQHLQAARAEPSRHTHTVSLSLSPAGGRAINNHQSASPVFTPFYPSFELSRRL